MDWQQYQKQPAEARKQVWSDLAKCPGWQLLRLKAIDDFNELPEVKTRDDRERFYAQALVAKAKLSVFNEPDFLIALIDSVNTGNGGEIQ